MQTVGKSGGGTQAVRRWRWALALAVVAAVAGLFAKDIREMLVPKRFSVVEPGVLYRSGQMSRMLVERVLTENGIRVVIDLHKNTDPMDANRRAEQEAIARLGIEQYRFSMSGDGVSSVSNYAAAVMAVDTARREHKPCLVHCAAGTERTGGVIFFCRVLIYGWTRDAAQKEILQSGHVADRNAKLLPFIDANFDAICRAYETLRRRANGPE